MKPSRVHAFSALPGRRTVNEPVLGAGEGGPFEPENQVRTPTWFTSLRIIPELMRARLSTGAGNCRGATRSFAFQSHFTTRAVARIPLLRGSFAFIALRRGEASPIAWISPWSFLPKRRTSY